MRKSWVSGQNLVEVAILFALVVGVVATMQLYIQRSFHARYKAGADYVHRELVNASPAFSGLARQYDPYYAESWQRDRTNYTTLSGYPNNTVNQVLTRRVWGLTDVPGQND
jgi:hypothetical protein